VNKKITFLAILLGLLLFTDCKGKVEEEVKEKTERPATEKKKEILLPSLGPHNSEDIRNWIKKTSSKAGPDILKKAEGIESKFTAEEIVAGMAVRLKPDYWENVSDSDKLKTLSIINTSLSKARIQAGLAEDVKVLNSTLYIEDEKGRIIAVSTPKTKARFFPSK